ncbi:free fatty acid receptor 3-like isoform 1-T2 [Menidia menidia]
MEMLLLSVYIFTFLTGVPANILAFSTLLRKACRKAAPVDVLLLNLTGSDLLLLAFLPLKMKEAQDGMLWRLPYALCPLTGFLFYVSIYTSTLLLAAVSVERYLAVAFPLRWSVCRRPRYAAWACAAFWLLTSANLSIVYILPYIQWRHGAGGGPNASACAGAASASAAAIPPPPTCYLHFTEEELSILLPVRLELFLVLFCVPFAVSCFCYTNFVLILSRLPRLSRRRRLRGIGLAVGTLLVFALCFGPYNASHVVGYVTRESQPWRDVALLSSTLNTCLDPFIFYFSSAAVREALSCCLRGAAAKLHLLFRWRQAPPRMRTETRKYEAGAPPFVLEPRRPEEEQHAGQRAALDGV